MANKVPRTTNNTNKSPQSHQTTKVPHQVHAMPHLILATSCSDMNNTQLTKTRKALTKFVDSAYERTTKRQKTLHQGKQNEDVMKGEQDRDDDEQEEAEKAEMMMMNKAEIERRMMMNKAEMERRMTNNKSIQFKTMRCFRRTL